MTKLFQFALFCLFATSLEAAEMIPGGYQETIKSDILSEQRDYFVYLPPDYDNNETRFPVIYVLDGDVHRWRAITGVVEGLSTWTLKKQMQEAIVVAIPNTNRERDLTPSQLTEWTFEGRVLQTFDSSGGAAKFQTFLQQEFIPHINTQYRTTERRVLVGESFGGLFAAYTLMSQSALFTDYLIIDPTAVWDNNFLNRFYSEKSFAEADPAGKVYFAFANNAKLGPIGDTNKKWGQAFASRLEQQKTDKFSVTQAYFEDETHGTVAMLGWYNGLKLLLRNEPN